MTLRVTRAAAARISADQDPSPPETVTAQPPASRKRKAPNSHNTDSINPPPYDDTRRSKRARAGDSAISVPSSAEGGRNGGKRATTAVTMSGAGYACLNLDEDIEHMTDPRWPDLRRRRLARLLHHTLPEIPPDANRPAKHHAKVCFFSRPGLSNHEPHVP